MLRRLVRRKYSPLILQTSRLIGFVSGTSYAGASPLFAAYLAGALISWWDYNHASDHNNVDDTAVELHPVGTTQRENTAVLGPTPKDPRPPSRDLQNVHISNAAAQEQSRVTSQGVGKQVRTTSYGQVVEHLLKSFFFVRGVITSLSSSLLMW